MNFLKKQEVVESQAKEQKEMLEKQEKSFIGYFVNRYRITYLIIGLILAVGTFALMSLPREAEPEIDVPYVAVSVLYPGASPSDVEDLIIEKLEDKMSSVEDIKKYTASAGNSYGSLFVEFEAEVDKDEGLQDVKDAVDEAKVEFPEEAEEPVVQAINFNDTPIVTYSLSGDYSDRELKKYAEYLQDEFEGITDVSEAKILGAQVEEYQIHVDQDKLLAAGVSFNQVTGAISNAHKNIPSGDIEINKKNYNIRTEGKFEELDDIKNVIVAYKDGAPIYLTDLATVDYGVEDRDTISRLGQGGEASKNTISLQIYKKGGGNTLKIVENAEKALEGLEGDSSFPSDIVVSKTNDNAKYIEEDIKRLGTSGMQTIILIVIFLFAVLGLRGSLIAGVSVPLAFLLAFIIIMMQGMTLNSMVLFSLVLSLGLMVDTAIIVMEGIDEFMSEHGKSAKEAALLSIATYKYPIISGTMTSVSAFLPMLLVSGIMGEYIGILPKTLAATLLSSLFIALIVIPALSSRFYKYQKRENKYSKKIGEKIKKWKLSYADFLHNVLLSKAKRRLSIFFAVIASFLVILLPVSGIMKVEMFPSVDFDFFIVNVEKPVGTNLEETEKALRIAEREVMKVAEVENYVSTIGQSYSVYAGEGTKSGEHFANIIVNLKEVEDRDKKSYEIAEELRAKIEALPGAKYSLEEISGGPPTGAPFEVRIFGDEFTDIYKASEEVKRVVSGVDGLINVKDSLDESTGDLVFSINKEKAKYYGVDTASVAMSLRQAISGANVGSIYMNGEDKDIVVKYKDDFIYGVEDLKNIVLFNNQGQAVRVKDVANLSIEPSVFELGHQDGEKIIKISANLEKDADLRKATEEFNNAWAPKQAKYSNLRFEVGGETEDITKSFTEIFMSLILGIFLIFFILVMQFNSFSQPFIILFSLPLAVVGAFFGLTVMNLAFSMPAFIGLVSLTGIVVNDSIVLIDRINKNRERSMSVVESATEAAIARMQPIFLTSTTTIAGIFPLALSEEMWAGLGFTIIFGLAFATLLILLFIPILYVSMTKEKKK